MSDTPKDNSSFFRKVVRFVANPATEWAEIGARPEDGAVELEKSELKAMVERKKRNDFVRKREFDMLRKVRREGLTPEQLAALGGSSRLDDSEAKLADSALPRPAAEGGVKAKIDEIEQQMVGDSRAGSSRRMGGNFGPAGPPADFHNATTVAAAMPHAPRDPDRLPALPPLPDPDRPGPAGGPAVMAKGLSPLSPAPARSTGQGDFGHPFAVEVSEVVHDPELDEAVISFANAEFAACEGSLTALTGVGGARAQHAETWLVLFDLFRATGQQAKFEVLAGEYAQQFGWSAPQWFSLPKLVAEAAAAAEDKPRAPRPRGDVGWVCPAVIDIDAVARLNAQTLQMPLPWVFDFADCKRVEAEAASHLTSLFRRWAGEPLDMRWLDGEKFFAALTDAAPTGVRDADPAFWLTRLEGLRIANRADQFDEVAMDYCITYEVSPPSWERARCQVRISGHGSSTHSPSLSQVGDVSTSFLESSIIEDSSSGVQMTSVELSGQLVGDISETLTRLDAQLGAATVVSVTCGKLIRVDFVAAGDLLNWVLAKRGENRTLTFAEAHRLVALFFGAMGINEHAKVSVGTV